MITRTLLWRCAHVGLGSRVLGRVWVHGDGQIEIGANVLLDGRRAPIELRTAKGGRLIIGDEVWIEGGVSLEAEGRLELRPRVHVQGYAKIIDNHFHRITGDRNERRPPGEVLIEEDVVIGTGAIILPGSHLGRGSQIGARAVVSKRVPAGVTVAGNPAHLEG